VELLLNLVWLFVAAFSLLLWGVHTSSISRGSRNFTAFIALVCVLCFLFPVISMSDDLSNSPALWETGKLKKWVSAGLAEALTLFSVRPQAFPETKGRRAANLHAEFALPAQELAWSNLDRRPPPQHS
jgi:hypothetical protein